VIASLPSPTSPVTFGAGPFALRYRGPFVASGIVVATWLTGGGPRRKGSEGTLAFDSLFFMVPLGSVGARAHHVATDYKLYTKDLLRPGVFGGWNGGLWASTAAWRCST
jgi:prolipoprotein diacylglyceryltransferase